MDHPHLASAIRTLNTEQQGLQALIDSLDGPLGQAFISAVELIAACEGRVILTGVGKSGHVGRKITATLASTGTPAHFVHSSEASHGDLGMLAAKDVILALSWSGETAELKDLINYSRRFDVSLVAVTSQTGSTLGRAADIVLGLPQVGEACPHGLAPTTSTTMQLAIGDALAVALLERKGFTAQNFKQFHPGGKLGASLSFMRDLMHGGAELPLTQAATPMSDALLIMTEKSFGCLGIVDEGGLLAGIITDGDLRRHMSSGLLDATAADIMTASPVTAPPDMLASEAMKLLNSVSITSLFVVDNGRPIGIVHIHDLLRAGVA